MVTEMFCILTALMSISWLCYCLIVFPDVTIGGNY